jgi:hypothetical protein
VTVMSTRSAQILDREARRHDERICQSRDGFEGGIEACCPHYDSQLYWGGHSTQEAAPMVHVFNFCKMGPVVRALRFKDESAWRSR